MVYYVIACDRSANFPTLTQAEAYCRKLLAEGVSCRLTWDDGSFDWDDD